MRLLFMPDRKAYLCLCSLSPGVESRVSWGRLVLSCFCHCVVCLAVKQGEPPEKAMQPLPILPHHLFLTVSNPSPLIFTISVMVCLLWSSLMYSSSIEFIFFVINTHHVNQSYSRVVCNSYEFPCLYQLLLLRHHILGPCPAVVAWHADVESCA